MHRFHFISGLPRSGSTLLSALLRQNPRFHAGMSSPVGGLVGSVLGEMSGRNEFSVFIDDTKRRHVLKSIVESYYSDLKEEVIIDTSRVWTARMGLLSELFPQGKVIACVRQLSWIVDSIEQLIQKNVFQPSMLFGFNVGGTVYSRADALTKPDGMVGHPYNALREAFFGGHASNLMLLQYETLVSEPGKAMAAIYDFIGEPLFNHDFENIEYDASAFDRKASTPGLHEVRRKIAKNERNTLLPPDLFKRYLNDTFWRDPQLNRNNVRIV